MAKKEKNIIEAKWLNLKAISKSDNPSIEQIDELTCDLLANLAELSVRGVEEIEGVSIDLYKDRVWWVVEKHGLLPEYRNMDCFLSIKMRMRKMKLLKSWMNGKNMKMNLIILNLMMKIFTAKYETDIFLR